jgi:Ser/Thr protein kinase RdoA (MazF antagonist)
LPAGRRDPYQRLLDHAPRLLARYHSHRNLTVIHGDAHSWNSFLPRHGGGENVIDWEDCKEVPVCEIAAKSQDRGVLIALLWGAPRWRSSGDRIHRQFRQS